MSNQVFVLYSDKTVAMPCHPARARELRRKGRAAVYRLKPYTIILTDRQRGDSQPVELKVDPGSKATGLCLVGEFQRGRKVIWAANLEHRGQAIKKRLQDRAMYRRGRRGRKTRYRPPRFLNRCRPKGWLAPSLQSRVDNVKTWAGRLLGYCPVTEIAVETVRFDTQQLQNPEIDGVAYQRGELFGYEVREYLLEKWNRQCAYCGAQNVPLEIEHITAKSRGGSDRVSNLALACNPCNQAKNNQPVEVFLAHDPARLKRIKAQAKAPLKDAAAVNSIRYAIGDTLKSFGLPVTFWSGGRTKFNRIRQGYEKDHFIDAACVGESGQTVFIRPGYQPLHIKAVGRGQRQVQKTDKYGFPRGKAGRCKRVKGFQTGDVVKLVKPKGKDAGTYQARLTSIREKGAFSITVAGQRIFAAPKHFTLLQHGDGYAYP